MFTKAITKKRRNGLIDVLRLCFAFLIMMYHFYGGEGRFVGGRFGVEYFIILSGFLFFMSWELKNPDTRSLDDSIHYWKSYTLKRYFQLFGYGLIGFLFSFVVQYFYLTPVTSLKTLLGILTSDIWEVLLIKPLGLNCGKALINSPAWTLGCMLFAEFLIGGMLVFHKKFFLLVLMPLSALIGVAYWLNLEDTRYNDFLGFITFGQLRVYILTCLGIYSYWIYTYLIKINFSAAGRALLTSIELLSYILCLFLTYSETSQNIELCIMLMLVCALAISFSGKSYSTQWVPSGKFTSFCASFSLVVYLSHSPVRKIYNATLRTTEEHDAQAFEYFIFAIAVALVAYGIIILFNRIKPALIQIIRSIFLEKKPATE